MSKRNRKLWKEQRSGMEPLERRRLFAMTHLYTFNDGTANDTIGTAHGTLFNGAQIVNGRLVLQNAGKTSATSSSPQYAQLPNNVLPASGSLTINAWYITFSSTPTWTRVFDFGTESGTSANSYVGFTPKSSGGVARAMFKPGTAAELNVTSTTRANQGYQHMVTTVIDSVAASFSLYIDGVLIGSAPTGTATVGQIAETSAYLGRSLFDSDSAFSGSIDELQIYDEALGAATIAALNTAGPALPAAVSSTKQMEALDRGLVAMSKGSGQVYLSWRLFGTESASTGFNIYRQTGTGSFVKRNASLITATTDFTDTGVDTTQVNRYYVRAVVNGVEQAASEVFTLGSSPTWDGYFTIPLNKPADGVSRDGTTYTYVAGDGSVGDLDGDGEYEYVIKWWTEGSTYPGPELLDAYELDGTHLWRINLGTNVNVEGDFFVVYDLDGDGRAEVVAKTADGTRSGTGEIIGNANADWMNAGAYPDGWTVRGPEYLTVFSGQTGGILATTNFLPARGNLTDWGDNYGQRGRQTKGAVAYLDGVRPSLVITRGIYYAQSGYAAKIEMAAFDYRNGMITPRWFFRSAQGSNNDINNNFVGQGNHQLSIADVDSDGKQEIIIGAMVVDDNGQPLASTQLEHGDSLHVTDIDPTRPGLEVYGIHENEGTFDPNRPYGAAIYDPRTGKTIWGMGPGLDTGRGVAADIDPNSPGLETWSIGAGSGVYSAKGTQLTTSQPASTNFAVWWDGDLGRELLDRNYVEEWNPSTGTTTRIMQASGVGTNQGTKQFPVLTGDFLGDWREEIIWRTADSTALRIYATTTPSAAKIYTLMHDPQYRVAIAWQNQGYNQPPHPGFYLGVGMTAAPTPDITTISYTGSTAPAAPTITATLNTSGQTLVTWNTIAGATSYRIKRSDDAGGVYYILASNVSGTSFLDTTAKPGGKYYYTVTATSGILESAASNEASVSSPMPWPWTVTDIGSVTGEGRSELEDGVFRIRSFTASSNDGFRFINQQFTGDHTLTIRVDSKNNNIGAAGLQFRASTANNSAFASITAEPTDNNRIFFRYRNTTGGSATYTVAYATLPVYLRLTRVGNAFTGFYSPDGVTWTQVGTRTISMNSTIPGGIMVSGSTTASTWANISNVSFVPASNSAPTATPSIPATVNEGSSALVSLLNATDAAADLSTGLRYAFDFNNDGVWEITNAVSPSALIPSSYFPDGPATVTVNAAVYDRYGATSTYTGSISVANVAPSVEVGSDLSIPQGTTVNINPTVTDPGTADTLTRLWNVLDSSGRVVFKTNTPSLSYTPSMAGLYTVKLTVTDKDGAASTDTLQLTVTPPPTVITAFQLLNPATGQVALTLTDGMIVDATALGLSFFNIRADTIAGVASVVFNYRGRNSYRIDNSAPYTLFDTSLSVFGGRLLPGEYVITVAGYSGINGGGALLGSSTIRFTVVGGSPVARLAGAPDVRSSPPAAGTPVRVFSTVVLEGEDDPLPKSSRWLF